MKDFDLFLQICHRIESYQSDMIQLQYDLTAIPALSPENGGDGEHAKARFLFSKLHTLGFRSIQQMDSTDERVSSGLRPNLFTEIQGKHDNRTVWILTHMDVVPPGERVFWEDDPYHAYMKDGRIYGRGTEDNQQDLVASIFAARAFLDEGIVPEHSIGLALVSDEETNSQHGLYFILNHPKNPFRKGDWLVVPDAGNEDGSMIEVAEKSILWVRFRIAGKQCHASRPKQGRNAFLSASHLAILLDESLHASFNIRDEIFDPPESTFELTKRDANVPNVNTIPGEDVFYMDCRVLPRYSLLAVLKSMREAADEIESRFSVQVTLEVVQQGEAPPPTPIDAPVVGALRSAVRDVYGVKAKPRGIGGNTVAAFLRRDGYHAVVWSRVDMMAHQPNEYCMISNMIGNAKVFAHLFL